MEETKGTCYCKNCKKDVTPVTKMFDTKICPDCHIILSSNRGIEKGGI